MAEIRITLRSDLCSGSGESAGNRIDNDIYTDACGLPYIPARRIKGCLRDAAMELRRMGCPEAQSDEAITALFGDGDGRMGCLQLEDAQLPGSESIKAFLRRELPEPLRRYAAPAEIAKIFSYVRGNTRMEDGVAARGSLRFTRVLSQDSLFHPGEDTQMTCRVYQPEPRLDALLTKCCRATRRMGMNRNRGLGAVRLEYVPGEVRVGEDFSLRNVAPGARVEIAYRVALNAPIALNGCGEQLTAIPAAA